MSTYSPTFNLVLATTSDQVNVVTQIAANFSSLDSILSICHTGTGQFKSGVFLASPGLSSPTITGSMTGVFSLTASTGAFNTITATGGAVTVNSFSIGTYSLPQTIGATSAILTVVTGNAQWAAAAPNTGANQALSNLASVAINTNLNTFTAGFVTVDRLITTSGALTGLTSFQAATGTFAGNVTISGTATINAVNCTGGAGTFASVTVGTWGLPSTIGAAGQIMQVSGGTAGWGGSVGSASFSYYAANSGTVGAGTTGAVTFATAVFDPQSLVTTGGLFTAPAAGTWLIGVGFSIKAVAAAAIASGGLIVATTKYAFATAVTNSASGSLLSGDLVLNLASGATVYPYIENANNASVAITTNFPGHFYGHRIN